MTTTRLPPISPPKPLPMFQKDVKSLLDSLPFVINFDHQPSAAHAMSSDPQQQKRVYLLGCVDGRTHTQYMRTLACDLMPWFYVSCNPTESQLATAVFQPQLHLCADLVIHWSNAFTDTPHFQAQLHEASQRGVPILTLKTPISKRLSDRTIPPDIIFDPTRYAQSLGRLLTKLETVLKVKLDFVVPSRIPISSPPQQPQSARAPRISRRSSSMKARGAKRSPGLQVDNIPRFLTDASLHKTRSPDAESGYGSEKLISTLSASEPHLYHPTRYLIFDRPQPDSSQHEPLLLNFPDDLPRTQPQADLLLVNSSDDEDVMPNTYFFKYD